MPQSIQVAAIQMDGSPAPTEERLERAASLIKDAVAQGAKLVVLPAAFNTGKTFLETNYEVTERLSDITMQWLCQQAKQHQIHLAASWMIVDQDDTYNAGFIIAPDGKSWRYDQHYPYLWERVFYRNGKGLMVADTTLGKIGMMIGWDAAHPDLWERYAAKVDLMLILNDSLNYEQGILQYKNGSNSTRHDFGFAADYLFRNSANYLQNDLEAQVNWTNIPTICVGASGQFNSILPAPFFSVQGLLFGRSSNAKDHYADMQFSAPFQHNTRILDANGQTINQVDDEGNRVLISEITLADKTPLPLDEPQPEMTISDFARTTIDLISSALLSLNYRRGVRRQWGARMAPVDADTRIWLKILIIVATFSALLSRLFFSKRR